MEGKSVSAISFVITHEWLKQLASENVTTTAKCHVTTTAKQQRFHSHEDRELHFQSNRQ